ncbi:MAG: hypothetical protein HZB25_03325 [Candidatus Eisenbacteria bacterium]|nr:hypothetical protein [Candidatus Eisenbacteria bacterium]
MSSRSVIFRLALALAVILGLPRVSGAASVAGPAAGRAGAVEPVHVTPRALEAWRWRQSLDRDRSADVHAAGAFARPAAAAVAGEQGIINDTTGTMGTDQDQVAAASYPGRNIVVVWRDVRFGDGDVRALLLDPSGQPIVPHGRTEPAWLVNDDAQYVDQQRPAVAMNAQGDFVVVWSDSRQGASDVWMQRFLADGSAVGPNLKCNVGRDDEAKFTHTRPAVAMDDVGNVVVAWADDRSSVTTDIFAVRFDSANRVKITPFQVSVAVGTPEKLLYKPFDSTLPAIAFTNIPGDSSFMVAWQARNLVGRGGKRSIFGRMFTTFHATKGAPLDLNMVLLDDRARGDSLDVRAASRPALLPPTAGDTSGTFTLAWVDSLVSPGVIRARRIAASAWLRGGGAGSTASVVVSDSTGLGATSPSLARLRDGSLTFSWLAAQSAGGAQTVHERLLSAALAPLSASQRLNSGGGLVRRNYPRTVAFGTDQEPTARLAAWSDFRTGNNDVVLRVLGSGASQDSALVRDRQPDQVSPHVSYNTSGKGVAVWTDFRNGTLDPDVYGQVLDASGGRVGANFRVNSDAAGSWQDHPRVAMDDLGGFTVVWEDARTGNFLLYRRHFRADNAPDGAESQLAGPGAGASRDTFQQFRPAISGQPGGGGVVAWEDNRRVVGTVNPVHVVDIWMVPVDASGLATGSPVRASLGDGAYPSTEPSVAVDPAGNGVLFWNSISVQTQGTLAFTNKDVVGRFFRAPGRLVPMLDELGRLIASQSFSVTDSLGLGFLFTQQRSATGYLGLDTYAVAFQDERLGTTSREDIRGRLYRVRYLTGDTLQVYPDGPSFLVNDDTVALEADAAGFVNYLSASQYDPQIAADPAGNTFTVMWADRRTGANYNVMRQGYHAIPAADAGTASQLRFLGRNLFVNTDTEFQDAVHGSAVPAYSGASALTVVWQSDRIKRDGYDIYSLTLAQAPDTCANADCRLAARIGLTAALHGSDVRVRWNVPAEAAGGNLQLLRYDLAAYGSGAMSRPVCLGTWSAAAGPGGTDDRLDTDAANFLYELVKDGAVVASARPLAVPVVPVHFSLGLGQVRPNPARGMARISFVVPGRSSERVPVKLLVFDVSGRQVHTLVHDTREAGPQSVAWDGALDGGSRAGSGVYFLRLDAGGHSLSRKVLWLR